jgi:hypothetical protein
MNRAGPVSPRAGFGEVSPTELTLLSKPTAVPVPLTCHGELYRSRRCRVSDGSRADREVRAIRTD